MAMANFETKKRKATDIGDDEDAKISAFVKKDAMDWQKKLDDACPGSRSWYRLGYRSSSKNGQGAGYKGYGKAGREVGYKGYSKDGHGAAYNGYSKNIYGRGATYNSYMGGQGGERVPGFQNEVPHESYVCHRCGIPGHFIQCCPTNGDPTYDKKKLRRPTGIPKTMLTSDSDGAYFLPTGEVAILKPNEAVFEREMAFFTVK